MAAKTKAKAVKYIGTADARQIDKLSWEQVGVTDQEFVSWDASNGFTVLASDLSAGALAYCAERDAGFVVLEDDEKDPE